MTSGQRQTTVSGAAISSKSRGKPKWASQAQRTLKTNQITSQTIFKSASGQALHEQIGKNKCTDDALWWLKSQVRRSLAVAHGSWRMTYTRSGCSSAAGVTVLLSGPYTASQHDKPRAPHNFFFFFYKTSGIMDMEIRPGLLIKKDIRETVSYNWQRCSKVICCNLKQVAHFWDDFQDSVLSVTCRGKKGKALVF